MAIGLSVKHGDEQLSRGMNNWMISRGILEHGNAKTTVCIHSWMFFFTSRVRMSHCHVCLVGQKHTTCLPIWNQFLLITLHINPYVFALRICKSLPRSVEATKRTLHRGAPAWLHRAFQSFRLQTSQHIPTTPAYTSFDPKLESWKAV